MELARYVAIIRRWWWTIVVATWAAGLAGYVAATRLPATYESEATVLVGPVSADFDTQRAAGQLVQTYAEIVRSGPVVQSTIDELQLDASVGALRRQISAIADSTTRFLTIRVQYESPNAAADIANTLYEKLAAETSGGTIRPEGQPTLWEEALPEPDPVAPDVGLIVALGAGAGLVGALFLVISVEYLVAPVRDPAGLAAASGVPTLGVVDTWRARGLAGRGRLLASVAPDAPAAVAYRLLARRLSALPSGMPRTIAIVAPSGNVGTGEIAANLGVAMALGGTRAVVVDGNDEEQSLSRLVGLWGHRGLDDIVDRGGDALFGLVDTTANPQFIAHGPRVSLPLIDSSDARVILDLVLSRGDVDVVVVDAGAAGTMSNTLLWAGAADATVIVAKRDQTRSGAVSRVSEMLGIAGARVVGTVLHARRLRNIHQARGRQAQAASGLAPADVAERRIPAPIVASPSGATSPAGEADMTGARQPAVTVPSPASPPATPAPGAAATPAKPGNDVATEDDAADSTAHAAADSEDRDVDARASTDPSSKRSDSKRDSTSSGGTRTSLSRSRNG